MRISPFGMATLSRAIACTGGHSFPTCSATARLSLPLAPFLRTLGYTNLDQALARTEIAQLQIVGWSATGIGFNGRSRRQRLAIKVGPLACRLKPLPWIARRAFGQESFHKTHARICGKIQCMIQRTCRTEARNAEGPSQEKSACLLTELRYRAYLYRTLHRYQPALSPHRAKTWTHCRMMQEGNSFHFPLSLTHREDAATGGAPEPGGKPKVNIRLRRQPLLKYAETLFAPLPCACQMGARPALLFMLVVVELSSSPLPHFLLQGSCNNCNASNSGQWRYSPDS